MTPKELLVKISSILDDLKISYAVIGGYAVSVWGQPRYTADVDIIIELEEKNVAPLAKKLLAIEKHGYVDEDMMRGALVCKGEFNFIDPDYGLKVDFFVQESTPYNSLKLKRAIPQEIFGHQVRFVTPEDLILSKLIWSKESMSFKQFEDIKTILKNDTIQLDTDYIAQWAEKQDTLKVLNSLLGEIKNR